MNSVFLGLALFWRPKIARAVLVPFQQLTARCHAAQFADVEDAACGLEALQAGGSGQKRNLGIHDLSTKQTDIIFLLYPTVITVCTVRVFCVCFKMRHSKNHEEWGEWVLSGVRRLRSFYKQGTGRGHEIDMAKKPSCLDRPWFF